MKLDYMYNIFVEKKGIRSTNYLNDFLILLKKFENKQYDQTCTKLIDVFINKLKLFFQNNFNLETLCDNDNCNKSEIKSKKYYSNLKELYDLFFCCSVYVIVDYYNNNIEKHDNNKILKEIRLYYKFINVIAFNYYSKVIDLDLRTNNTYNKSDFNTFNATNSENMKFITKFNFENLKLDQRYYESYDNKPNTVNKIKNFGKNLYRIVTGNNNINNDDSKKTGEQKKEEKTGFLESVTTSLIESFSELSESVNDTINENLKPIFINNSEFSDNDIKLKINDMLNKIFAEYRNIKNFVIFNQDLNSIIKTNTLYNKNNQTIINKFTKDTKDTKDKNISINESENISINIDKQLIQDKDFYKIFLFIISYISNVPTLFTNNLIIENNKIPKNN